MEKRKILFGSYDTARDGLWTLTGWTFPTPERYTNIVEVPGRKKGPLDLSTVLTDGEPVYTNRQLTATFESSEGARMERENRIETMVNWLDGWSMNIMLPDDSDHYIVGRVSVSKEYNDMAHAAVIVTATCEPWRYSVAERVRTLTAETSEQVAVLTNSGRLTVSPMIEITGDGAMVNLVFGAASWSLGPGFYQLPDLILKQGDARLTYSGAGTVKITYREAVL